MTSGRGLHTIWAIPIARVSVLVLMEAFLGCGFGEEDPERSSSLNSRAVRCTVFSRFLWLCVSPALLWPKSFWNRAQRGAASSIGVLVPPWSVHVHLHLGSVEGRNVMTTTAPGFVALGSPDLDGRPFCGCRTAVNEALVSGSEIAAPNADRVQLVDFLGDGQELGYGAKGLTSEVHVRSRHDHPDSSICQRVGNPYDSGIEKLGFVDGDHVYATDYGLSNLR